MMKLAIFITFLTVIIAVTSNDLNVGSRQDGDILAASRRLIRPGHPIVPSIAVSGLNVKGNITAIKAINLPGSNATISIVKGGPGQNAVVILAVSPRGHGINVQLDIFAKIINGTGYRDADDADVAVF